MENNIRIRDAVKNGSIKVFDHTANVLIKTRSSVVKAQSAPQAQDSSSPIAYATDKVTLRSAINQGKNIKTATTKTIKTAKTTVRATKRTFKVTRAVARTTVKATKATVKTSYKVIKAIAQALKGLVAALGASGSIAAAVIVLICMFALLLYSVYGIFFSGHYTGGDRMMPDVITELTSEFYEKIEEIKSQNPHDVEDINDMSIPWNEVLAIYAVKVNTEDEVLTINPGKVDTLRGVLNDMISLSYSVDTETQQRIVTGENGEETTESVTIIKLNISLNQKSTDEMAAAYDFSAYQMDQLHELLRPEYAYMWAWVMGGYASGSGDILITDSAHSPKDIFSWPLPSDYRISSYFGYRKDPITGETKYHGGLDIAAPNGIPILAAADGTVIVANATDSWGGKYGYYVKIQHNSTYCSLYAHCSQIAVVNGQQVQKGQVIGYVGSTGYSTGNHLHFEVYQNGARVDPLGFFN